MKAVVISGSPRKNANTQVMMQFVSDYARTKYGSSCEIEFVNLSEGQVECFSGFDVEYNESTKNTAKVITAADIWLIGTPIYNSFFSSALKNLFEYVDYKKTPGKTAGMAILAAGSIGFTDVQTVLTQLMSYFGVVTNPKAVFMTVNDISDTKTCSAEAQERLRNLVDTTFDMASKLTGNSAGGGDSCCQQ